MAKGMSFKVLMQLQTKEFQKGIQNIQRQLKGFANFMKSAFALGSITMFGRQVVQAGKDFENAMARVQSVSNATQEEFKKMSDEAQRLGETTRYTATEAAEALENLTRNGMSAANATKALSSVLQLAQANSISLAEAANIVTNTLNMFNLSISEAQRVNDVLSSTASHAATDITSLYEAMVNAAPAANVLGFSIEEVSSAIGALAQRGVKGAEAGTKLRIAFQKMADPKVVAKMHDLGIEVDETTMKSEGLLKTVEKIGNANLSLGQLGKVFDAKSAMAVQMLVSSLEDLEYMLDVTANSAGETERMFNQSVGSVQKELDTLKSMYEGLLISISQKTSGAVKGVVRLLQNLIINFKSVGGTIANIASVVVPMFASKIVSLGISIKSAMASAAAGVAALKTAMGGIISVVATLVTWIGTALVGAWNRSQQAMRDAKKQMDEARISAINMQNAVDRLKEKIGDGSNRGSLTSALKEATRLFPEFADAINNAKKIAEKTGEWDKLKGVLQDIADLQGLITSRDAKKAIAEAQAGKIGAKMWSDTQWWNRDVGGIADEDSRKSLMDPQYRDSSYANNKAAGIIRDSLKEYGFSKDAQKEVFNQIAKIITTAESFDAGVEDVKKLLKDYSIDVSDSSLRNWLQVYNPNANKNIYNAGRRKTVAGAQQTNRDIAVADSTIAANSYKLLKDNFEAVKRNTEEELGDIKKNQDEYNERMYEAAQDFFDKVIDLGLNPDSEQMNEAINIVSKYPKPTPKTTTTGGSGGGSSTNKVKTDADYVKDAIDDYNEAKIKLDNRLAAGTLTTKEYEDELKKLEDKTWETITAFSNFTTILQNLKQSALGFQLEKKYYNNRIKEGADKIAQQYDALGKYTIPSKPTRDTKYDYKKTPEQIAEEEVKINFDYAEALNKLVQDFSDAIANGDFDLVKDDAIDMLEVMKKKAIEAAAAADTLQTKLDLSEAITKLNEQIKGLQQTSFDTFQSVSQAMDRVMQGLLSIAEVFDEDVRESPLFRGIEAFTSVLNSGIQIMQATMSMIELVNQFKSKAAKETVLNAAMEVAANEAATESAMQKAAAEASAAAAEGASAVAAAPIIGPMLAVTAVASIVAALVSAFSKFESGGIVGGSKFSGDRNIVRVNSGEMILNRAQQGALWNTINGRGSSSGQVEFKIRGADLVGSIRNYNRLTNGHG